MTISPIERAASPEASATLLVQRADSPECTVIFEPYGSEYVLIGDDWLRIEVGGPPGGEVEVVHRPSSILLWPAKGWDYIKAVNRLGDEPAGLF